jgi:hypothetical protein
VPTRTAPTPDSTRLPDIWQGGELNRPGWLETVEALALAEKAVTVPSTLVYPGRPPRALPCIDLRTALLLIPTPPQRRDAAWAYVAERARTEQEPWNTFAVGLAFPGLVVRAGKITAGKTRAQVDEIEVDLIVEFLTALHDAEFTARPWILSRVLGRAAYRVKAERHRLAKRLTTDPQDGLDRTTSLDDAIDTPAANRPPGGPAGVIDRLIRRNAHVSPRLRLTELHYELIVRTYLDGGSLGDTAADLDLSLSNASKHRTRAEGIIAIRLGRPDLAPIPQPRTSGEDYSGSGSG